MGTILFLQASPRGDRSKSIAAARAYLDARLCGESGSRVITVDLFRADLPPFDGPALEAKYAIMGGEDPTAAQKDSWAKVEAIIQQFTGADEYVFAVPMWNFGIPYRLKQYFDVIVQPGHLFTYDPESGYTGLVTGKPARVFYARGGDFSIPEYAAFDQQRPYMDTILAFVGFTDIQSVIVEPTLMGGPDVAHQKLDEAAEQARALAARE